MKWIRIGNELLDLTRIKRIWKGDCGDVAIIFAKDEDGENLNWHFRSGEDRDEEFEQIWEIL